MLRKSAIRWMTSSGSSPRASARFAYIQSRSDWLKGRWTARCCEGNLVGCGSQDADLGSTGRCATCKRILYKGLGGNITNPKAG